MPTFTLRDELVRCGRKGCRSCPHGPYRYAYWREGGRTRKKYIGKIVKPSSKQLDEVMPRFDLDDDLANLAICNLVAKIALRNFVSCRLRYRGAMRALRKEGDLHGVAWLRKLWQAAWPGRS